ncbi:MAG: SAM-dependent DNA methyltransferase [Methanobrevibacter sp.]|nr:SAM-dependent DNA methyltransferase [Methanobrevibacter sp.]
MNRKRQSGNYRILRTILSKTRQIEATHDMSYLIAYAFLYKYCSDLMKEHFISVIEDKELTLDEAYKNQACQDMFRHDAFKMFGYYIKDSDFFIDEVINRSYSNRFFIHEFFTAFSKNLEFPEGSNYEKYFTFIFDAVSSEINMNKYEFEGENHLIVKDIIYSISKLDIFENEYPYEMVFDRLCQSNLMRVEQDPDYIRHILAYIVAATKDKVDKVYNPFLRDGSSLVDLSRYCTFGMRSNFGKSSDKLTCCCSIIKLYINNFDLNGVSVEYGSPFESVDMKSASFDVILSRIPPITPNNLKKLNKNQSIEMVKRNRRKQLENVLSTKFDMDEESFMKDVELNDALENLLSKMNMERDSEIEFTGEYESLKNSEYLFLINMIDCLEDDGVMVLSMPQGFLFKNSLETLRKYLTVEKNYIDAIIAIPDELSRPKRSEIIVIFRKNRNFDDIVFIDPSKEFKLIRSPYAMKGSFRRHLLLDEDTLKRIVEVYMRREISEKFSNVVRMSDLFENEFNLSISRYVDTFEGEFISLRDLKHQKEDIDLKLNDLTKKIEMMMDDLNIRL